MNPSETPSAPRRDASQSRWWNRGSNRRWALAFGAVILLAGGFVAWRLRPIRSDFYTDADTIHQPLDKVTTRDILWKPPTKLSEPINTSTDDYEPTVTADATTVYFVRGRPGHNADIFQSHKTSDGWSAPVAITQINSKYEDLGPALSADGSALYFYSDRPGGFGGYDLWVAYRKGDTWREPINLGPNVNSPFNDYGPGVDPDGSTLLFASNRPRPEDNKQPDQNAWPATLREDLYSRDYDLYQSSITPSGFGNARPLDALNSPFNEGTPAVSPVGDFVYFSSDRPDGAGGFDLYRSRRIRGKLEPPTALGAEVNTPADEMDPDLSLEGFGLHFSSNRSESPPPEGQRPDYNLYYTTSREVFTETQVTEASIDWSGLWSKIGPNLLWALLTLLLLLLLLSLLRGAAQRKLSLLARCLLASLLAHLLIMFLLNFWEVTASIADMLKRPGGIQVALVSAARADDVVSQIRGSFTGVEPRTQVEFEPQRQEDPIVVTAPTITPQHIDLDRTPVQLAPQTVVRIEAEESRERETNPAPAPQLAVSDHDAPTRQPDDVRIPQPPVRSNTEEAVEKPAPTPAPSAPTEKAPLSRPNLAARGPTKVDLPPTRSPDPSPASAHSLANAPTPHEAVSAHTASSTLAMTDARWSETTPAMPELTLSDLPQPSAQPVPEQATRPDIHPERIPRAASSGTPAARPIQAQSIDIKPTETTMEPTPLPLAESMEHQVSEADAERASSSPSIDLAAMADSPTEQPSATMPIDVPAMEESSAVAVEQEQAQEFVAHAFAPSRIEFENAPTPSDRLWPALQTSLNPVETETQAPSETLVSTIAPVDSNLTAQAKFSTDLPLRSDLNSVRSQIELPLGGLEQASVPSRTEEKELPAPANPIPHAPRADLDGASLAYAEANPSVSFAPSADDSTQVHDASASIVESLKGALAPDAARATNAAPTPSEDALTIPESLVFIPRVPTEEKPPDDMYSQRDEQQRLPLVKRMGGSERTEQAVANALKWLATHQSDQGLWDGDGFDAGCNECGGETDVAVDVGITGLATLCFLGAGHTHVADSPYRDNVRRALEWLLDQQKPDGDLRGDETMYSHGIATIALSEAYAMSGDERLADPLRRAVRFIEEARNQSYGGWRYDPGQPGDTSVLGWQIMALKSAANNGISVSAQSLAAGNDWLNLVSDHSQPGLYAYRPGRDATPSMTAEGMFIRQLLGRDPEALRRDPVMNQSAKYVLEHRPDWDDAVNTYFWYYATLALFQHQGDAWRLWNDDMTRELVNHQSTDGRSAGSWAPEGEWAPVGGRVYQTALCTLMLEVYYRYLPLYSSQPIDEQLLAGTLHGLVTDAITGDPLSGAAVRLDLPDQPPLITTTDQDGRYDLVPPEVPDHFAVSASREGYVPDSADVSAEQLAEAPLSLNFRLRPDDTDIVPMESDPQVHHLGNDAFEGRINSQFQRSSEGTSYLATFELTADQLPPNFNAARIWMLNKGVQCPHRLSINDHRLDARLEGSPSDGSFGEYEAEFDAQLLVAGENTLEITAVSCRGDLDDFEFVNVQVRLQP